MIVNPNVEELESMSILEHNPNFQNVLGWLTKSLEKTLEQLMIENDEVAVRRSQGVAVDLSEIIKIASEARNHIEKLKR